MTFNENRIYTASDHEVIGAIIFIIDHILCQRHPTPSISPSIYYAMIDVRRVLVDLQHDASQVPLFCDTGKYQIIKE